jgi:hypothetical protein
MVKIIDADGHIVEPRAVWEEYVEAQFRDRMPRLAKDSEGVDRFARGSKLRLLVSIFRPRCAYPGASVGPT